MRIIGLSGFLAVVVTSFAVGFRLLWLAAQTRQLPELTIGGAFVWIGGVPGAIVAFADDGTGNAFLARGGLFAAMSLSTMIGASLLAVFTWRVFRPTERWGVVAFGGVLAGLVAGYGSAALAGLAGSSRAWSLLGVGVAFKIATYVWAVAEATREWQAARRRVALGLTDPMVANRMLLWSIGLGAVLAIWIHEAITMATGPTVASFLVVAVFGFVCSGALSLAFFPPAFYRRRFALGGGA
jgi:hypothetical protein